MPGSETGSEYLHALLSRAVHEVALLEGALERETRALSTRELETLEQAVSAKHQAVQQLERLSREQGELLRSWGLAADLSGMETFLKNWDPETRIRPLWERLQDSAQRCRRHNEVNGGIVQTQQRGVQQAMRVLRGEDAGTELYDPRGQTVASGAPRSISHA